MRILFIDDHQLVREALVHYLRSSGEDVDIVEAGSLAEIVGAPPRTAFDFILLDYKLPGLSGDEAVLAASRHFPETPIIVLSGAMTRIEAQSALSHGAAGVISKDVEGRRLLGMIRVILDGEIEVFGLVDAPAIPAESECESPPAGVLSRRERQVAHLLVRGLSNKEIARELGLAEITIRLHVRGLFRKLGARSRTDAVRIILTRFPDARPG